MKTFKLIILILIFYFFIFKKYTKKNETFSNDSNYDCSGEGDARKKNPNFIFSPLTCGDYPVTKTDFFGGPLKCGCKKLYSEMQLENKNIFIKHSGKSFSDQKYWRSNRYRYYTRTIKLRSTRVKEHTWYYGYDKYWNGTKGYYRAYYPEKFRGKRNRHRYRNLLRWYLVQWDWKNRKWIIKNDFKHKLTAIYASMRYYPDSLRETIDYCKYDKNCIGVREFTHPKSKRKYYDYLIDIKNNPKKKLSHYIKDDSNSDLFIKGLYVEDAIKHKNVLTPNKCKKLIDIEKNDVFDHNGVIVRQNNETLRGIENWYNSMIRAHARGNWSDRDWDLIKKSYMIEKIEKIKNLMNSKKACNEGLPSCDLSMTNCSWWARTNGYPFIDLTRRKSCPLGDSSIECSDEIKKEVLSGCSKDGLNVYYNKIKNTENKRNTKCSRTRNKFE